MIDPLGPDPSDPAVPPRRIGEILPDIPVPVAPSISVAHAAPERAHSEPPPTKAVPAPIALAHPRQKPTKFERAIGVAKTVLPLVGKILPLLEGNVVATATNLLTGSPHEVNLKPLEESIARLQADQRALTFHTSEYKRTLRRLEDDFAALQEAVQKSAADQAELVEQVAKLAKRTISFMRLVTILLVLSMLLTTTLVIRMAYIIRF